MIFRCTAMCNYDSLVCIFPRNMSVKTLSGFSSIRPCRWILTTSSHCWAISKQLAKNSLWSVKESSHAPETHFMSLWIPGGLHAAERRCSLYCAAISHIGLCPWLPPSISVPSVLTTLECHLSALPVALSTLQLSGVTVKDSHCQS